jgi:hypothetical protein
MRAASCVPVCKSFVKRAASCSPHNDFVWYPAAGCSPHNDFVLHPAAGCSPHNDFVWYPAASCSPHNDFVSHPAASCLFKTFSLRTAAGWCLNTPSTVTAAPTGRFEDTRTSSKALGPTPLIVAERSGEVLGNGGELLGGGAFDDARSVRVGLKAANAPEARVAEGSVVEVHGVLGGDHDAGANRPPVSEVASNS